MSLALYRKYRPGTFAEVIGQEHITEPICQALLAGRVHHAYLFSGPRGCGKTSSARILARSLNCEQGPTPTPCGTCDSCVALAPMGPGSLDVIEIDAASHGLVDDARDLRERAFFAPVSSRFKIYVIDEAHMITTAAFNALLKVVEEPPPHVKFIFATTEPDKVLVTIKSRTFHYRFRLIPPQVMREHLAGLCAAEGLTVDPLVLPLIVRAAAGSARDAQSILDQLAAGAGDEGVGYDRALSLLGYTDAALQDEVVEAFAAADGAAVFRAVDRVIEAGLEPRRFAQDLLERFRDLLVLDAVPDAADSGLIDVPADELERMLGQAARYGRASLSRAADVMAAALVDMRGTTSPRLVLELACARVLLPGAASDTAALLARLDRLEQRIAATSAPPLDAVAATSRAERPSVGTPTAVVVTEDAAASGETTADVAGARDGGDSAASAPAPPVAAPISPVAAAPTTPVALNADTADPAPTAPTGVLDLAALRRLWDPVLDAVKRRSRTAHALMMSAQIDSLEDRTLSLSFKTPTLATRFANDVADFVVSALREVVGVDLVLRTTSAPAVGSVDTTAAIRPAVDLSEPDDDDIEEPTGERSVADPADSALALLKQGLGARVIGEIDSS
jgi:DNA polymerase-3 subunit gamma/tau